MTHGDGSIFKTVASNGKTQWKVEVTIGHNPDGTRRRTRRTATSYAHALKLRRQLVADRDEYDLSFDNPTLDSFALWWIREVRAKRIKGATAADYEHRYRKTISPFMGNRRVSEIKAHDITLWLNALGEHYSVASVNGSLRVLKMVLGGAVDHGHCRSNAAYSISPIRTPGKAWDTGDGPWDSWEARIAVDTAKNHRFGVAIVLGVVLGMRKGEILALRWGDISFEQGSVFVRRSLRESVRYGSDGKGSMVIEEGDPKTLASRRIIPIPAEVREFLYNHMTSSPGPLFENDHLYVLSSGDGNTPMTNARFRRAFQSFLKFAGLRPVRFHDLRHTAATVALEKGVRIESVSQALGHTRIDTTKSIYAPMVNGLNSEFSNSNFYNMFAQDI